MIKMTIFSILTLMIGLALGNFGYQWVFKDIPNYLEALDRTFFQSVAVVYCYWAWKPRNEKQP